MSLNTQGKNIANLTLATILFTSILFLGNGSANSENVPKIDTAEVTLNTANDTVKITKVDTVQLKKIYLRDKMVQELNDYILKFAPKNAKTLSPILVDSCIHHSIDISFAASQAHFESCFGKAGAGRTTARCSLFGVNGKFKNYHHAVSKYISLLKKNYLVNGKSEQDLLVHYVNKNNHRYASVGYEQKLGKYYNRINQATHIREYQKEYHSLSME